MFSTVLAFLILLGVVEKSLKFFSVSMRGRNCLTCLMVSLINCLVNNENKVRLVLA